MLDSIVSVAQADDPGQPDPIPWMDREMEGLGTASSAMARPQTIRR